MSLRAITIDAGKPDQERLRALARLRGIRDGRTREVVAAMVQLLENSVDAHVRADILRHLKGAVPVDMKHSVVARLRSDVESRVREEAAETLGPLAGDPEVRAALEYAAANDPIEKVRGQASSSLRGDRRRRE